MNENPIIPRDEEEQSKKPPCLVDGKMMGKREKGKLEKVGSNSIPFPFFLSISE